VNQTVSIDASTNTPFEMASRPFRPRTLLHQKENSFLFGGEATWGPGAPVWTHHHLRGRKKRVETDASSGTKILRTPDRREEVQSGQAD
jgi:hypothetical protein